MSDSPLSSQTYPLTVVIPTLGGESLAGTIKQLNQGTVVPAEILVCIPEKEAPRAEKLSFGNVKIVKTVCRGQVAQRAIGFQRASHELVLQLDDDIFVNATCIQNLVACMAESFDMAVGPKLYDLQTGQYHSFMTSTGKNSWFNRFVFWVINGSRGYEPGQVGRAGVNMGVPEEPSDWNNLGWLPGCCILHRRQNLILSDFYPFKGKAFAEDLFHSALLIKSRVRLMRCGAAVCNVDFSSSHTFDLISFMKAYHAYARAMTRLVRDSGGSVLYLYLYLFLDLIVRATRKQFSQKCLPTLKD